MTLRFYAHTIIPPQLSNIYYVLDTLLKSEDTVMDKVDMVSTLAQVTTYDENIQMSNSTR